MTDIGKLIVEVQHLRAELEGARQRIIDALELIDLLRALSATETEHRLLDDLTVCLLGERSEEETKHE